MRTREFAGTLLDIPGVGFGLQQRDNKPDIAYPGMIGIFGGQLEEVDEGDPEKAAVREFEEELSLRNYPLTFLGLYVIEDTNRFGEMVQKHIHVYSTEVELAVIESPDFSVYEGSADLAIIEYDADMSLFPLSPGTAQMLADYKAQKGL